MDTKIYRSARKALLAALLLGAFGCASDVTHTCSPLTCIAQDTRDEVFGQCMSALNRTMLTDAEQELVDAKYHYPLKNAGNYIDFIRVGGRGPSPRQWCQAYSKEVVARAFPNLALR